MIEIGEITTADRPSVLALNNASTPHVNELAPASLDDLLAEARLALKAVSRGELAGYLIAFGPGADYASPNYRWFAARYRRFLYVDRLAVPPHLRGRGIARRLYDAVFEVAGGSPVCCEVNIRPPNETSMRFHLALGMRQVGSQQTDGGSKEVALLSTASPGPEWPAAVS